MVWGRDDRVIPASHADRAAALAPDARVHLIAGAGHFPHDDPEQFADLLRGFVASTAPAAFSRVRWSRMLRQGRALETSVGPVPAVREHPA